MAIFYDEYLNESKEDRLQKKVDKACNVMNRINDDNSEYDPHYYDNKKSKDIKKDLKAVEKGFKLYKKYSDDIPEINDAANKKFMGSIAKLQTARSDKRRSERLLKQSLKDAKRKSIKEDTFNEACDYIGGCLNEEYSIDIDLLKESCEYVLNVIDEYNEEE